VCQLRVLPPSISARRRGAESHAANVLLQITYLNSVVMPDEEPSDSSEDEEEEGDGSDAGGGEEGDDA